MRSGVRTLIVFIWLPLATCSFGDLLYDVTFSTPPNQVGQSPYLDTTGSPRVGPTQNVFGHSKVANSIGDLTNQPVQLIPGPAGSFSYGQLQFDLGDSAIYAFPTNYPYYHLQMDVFLDHLATNEHFTVLVDSPYASSIDFYGTGIISRNVHASDPYYPNRPIGTFQFGTMFTLAIDLDVPANSWTITYNTQQIYSGQFYLPTPADPELPTSIRAFRINLADALSVPDIPTAAVDNIEVYGIIPEPQTISLTILFLALLPLVSSPCRPLR